MVPFTILATALMVYAVGAAPAGHGLLARQVPIDCSPNVTPGQSFAARVVYYEDSDCLNRISAACYSAFDDTIENGGGGCGPANLPASGTPFYARMTHAAFPDIQLLFTRDQTCPPDGPGSVFATMQNTPSCVQFNLGGPFAGVAVYPNGDSGISRTQGPFHPPVSKRQSTTECDGFEIDSQQSSTTPTVQVSNIINCVNGGPNGCEINIQEQETQSVSTSYSLSAGGSIAGIFSVEATFGQEFTQEVSTTIQNGFSVPQGQLGYIGVYSLATLFTGRFTGCNQGESVQEGTVLAVRGNGLVYSVVLTGAARVGWSQQ